MTFNVWKAFLEKYALFFEKLVVSEQEKLKALLSNDLKWMEKQIHLAQANQMKMQNLEDERLDLLEEQGKENYTFDQVIACFGGDEKNELQLLKERIQKAINNIQYTNEKTNEFLNYQIQMYKE